MRIVFCGVGALGSAAVVASRNLDASLALVDFDRVESKNLLAQAYVKQSVGKNKAQAVAECVEGPIAARWPASILQMHQHATVVVDEDAASQLRFSTYYMDTFAGKPDWQGI